MDARAIVRDVIGSVPEGAGTKTKGFPFSQVVYLYRLASNRLSTTRFSLSPPPSGCSPDKILWTCCMHILTPTRTRIQQSLPPGSSRFANFTTALAMAPLCGRAPVAFETIEEVRPWSNRSSEITHNHFEGIRGAQATLHAGVPTRIDKTDHRVLVRANPI